MQFCKTSIKVAMLKTSIVRRATWIQHYWDEQNKCRVPVCAQKVFKHACVKWKKFILVYTTSWRVILTDIVYKKVLQSRCFFSFAISVSESARWVIMHPTEMLNSVQVSWVKDTHIYTQYLLWECKFSFLYLHFYTEGESDFVNLW